LEELLSFRTLRVIWVGPACLGVWNTMRPLSLGCRASEPDTE